MLDEPCSRIGLLGPPQSRVRFGSDILTCETATESASTKLESSCSIELLECLSAATVLSSLVVICPLVIISGSGLEILADTRLATPPECLALYLKGNVRNVLSV